MNPRSRLPVVIVLVLALILSGFVGQTARGWRERAAGGRGHASASGSLAQMNSFALALLLGGLRGPLVMMLWMTSESMKSEKQLEDFDTRVEWIRLLQPEFDSVHLFQIWNKAYNISAQMASMNNKYLTILDALEYAHSVDRERPDNINIVSAIAGIYFDKLGQATIDKIYYIKRVRSETLPHPRETTLKRGDPGWRPFEHPALLDKDANILPEYRHELRFLVPFEPFPYGLTPLAIGYNYLSSAKELHDTQNQSHLQMSDSVLDSRPPIALRFWAEEELERARRLEARALDQKAPVEREALETVTASLTPIAPIVNPDAIPEALHSYGRASQLGEASVKAYEDHIKRDPADGFLYLYHIDHVKCFIELARADRDYLLAIQAKDDSQKQSQLLASAKENYLKTSRAYNMLVLKHHYPVDYVQPILPSGITITSLDKLPLEAFPIIMREAVRRMDAAGYYDSGRSERLEYEANIRRIDARLANIP